MTYVVPQMPSAVPRVAIVAGLALLAVAFVAGRGCRPEPAPPTPSAVADSALATPQRAAEARADASLAEADGWAAERDSLRARVDALAGLLGAQRAGTDSTLLALHRDLDALSPDSLARLAARVCRQRGAC